MKIILVVVSDFRFIHFFGVAAIIFKNCFSEIDGHARKRSFIWRGSNQHGDIMVQRSRKFRAKMISNEDLKKLPCFDYEAAEKGTSCVDCAVCLENFKMGEKCRLLPNCRHSFHVQCIDSWLLKTPICPICRTCIIPLKVEVIISEESSVSDNIAVELT
ncbi:ring-h2 finger protein atl74 [Quercus suber]|uniref:RING-type E3 ubiquitin transferase n=1 Tax=Quercus suber TaxID=58331 RepID=A0AAW0IXB7_QUESU